MVLPGSYVRVIYGQGRGQVGYVKKRLTTASCQFILVMLGADAVGQIFGNTATRRDGEDDSDDSRWFDEHTLKEITDPAEIAASKLLQGI